MEIFPPNGNKCHNTKDENGNRGLSCLTVRKRLSRRKKLEKARKRKRMIKITAFLSFAGIFLILAIWALLQPSTTKEPANEYFKITPLSVVGDKIGNKTWKISSISFLISPIQGNANNVIIKSWAMSEPQELGDLQKGEQRFVILEAGSPYLAEATENGEIPITLNIYSREAEGPITVMFKEPT